MSEAESVSDAEPIAELPKGARITGSARETLAAKLTTSYLEGESIRTLSAALGRSYGFVHRVLSESGVELRGRGGATRSKPKGTKP